VVRASARALRGGEDDYYEAEPNMKLSHAFMVVLILHVVAVGGIYAFNQVNAKKNANLLANISGRIAQATGSAAAAPAAAPAQAVAKPEPVAPPARQPGDADDPLPTVVSQTPSGGTLEARDVAPPAPPAVKTPAAKPAGPVVTSASATKAGEVPAVYTVAKGDNPYNIAKKFGVSYQDLLKVNNIEDPTKLQIGQVLKMPAKAR
jgi:LysM repeat protein